MGGEAISGFSKENHNNSHPQSVTMGPPTYSRDPGSSKARFSIIPDPLSSYQAVSSVLGIGREGRYNLVPKSSRQTLCLESSYDCQTTANIYTSTVVSFIQW